MIVGQLVNWHDHLSGDVWEEAFVFLLSLTAAAKEQKIHLRGDKMIGKVMAYPTRGKDEAILEAHGAYIGIQISLRGADGIDWYPESTLDIKEDYNEELDRVLYHRYEPAPAHVDNHPEMFTLLSPEDAHMAQLVVEGESEEIKKAVVKVHVSLLEEST
jgi:YhcH/YjgK/YiaL family protein